MDIGQQQLEKARIYAYLSYLAFVIPVLGLIFSAISISILQRLVIDEDDKDSIEERTRIAKHAIAMRWVGIAILVLYTLAIILGVANSMDVMQQNADSLRIHRLYD